MTGRTVLLAGATCLVGGHLPTGLLVFAMIGAARSGAPDGKSTPIARWRR